MAEFDTSHPGALSPAAAKTRAELDSRVKALSGLSSSWEELGPVYDCVVFHDGALWRAALDTSCTGDMSSATAYASFRAERKYLTLTAGTALSVALNVYDDGKTLSVACDAGSHGTHVAAITAAYHPEDSDLNGIAPGAQIVAIKIGDTRLGSMETNTGLIRALKAVVDNGCHLINLSYGEPTKSPNMGRFIELATRVVRRHNVIFVSSAGNSGPALSTVGAPGATSSALIGIGAMVSPAMMKAQYALQEELPSINYTWSSRGPAFDGALGVCVSAPGGAITSVPVWNHKKLQLMNGTSMSSPNACGNIALLLSGLLSQGRSWTPYAVRRALEASALPVEGSDVFGLGHGLLQTPAAFSALVDAGDDVACPGFKVNVPYGGAGAGTASDTGVYIRDAGAAGAAHEYNVSVTPLFQEPLDDCTPSANGDLDVSAKISYERRVALVSQAPEWVRCSSHILLAADGKSFSLRVDPRMLPPGSGVHHAQVLGFDADAPGAGPLFRVPITVVKPIVLPPAHLGAHSGLDIATADEPLQLVPGTISRHFLQVPKGATWVDVVLRRVDRGIPASDGRRDGGGGAGAGAGAGSQPCDSDAGDGVDTASRLLVLHTTQVKGVNTSFRDANKENYYRLMPGSQAVMTMAVDDTTCLELVLAQFWSSLGSTQAALRVMFRGVSVSPSSVRVCVCVCVCVGVFFFGCLCI